MRLRVRTALAVAAASAAMAPAALASTPETGYVDETRLKQTWSGEAYGQPMKTRALQDRFCINPFCDAFTLDVRATGTLTLDLNVPDSAYYVDVEVTLPDGTREFYKGNETDKKQVVVYENAALGAYTIKIWPNKLPGLYQPEYFGKATLKLPPPPEPTAPAQGA